MRKPLARVFLTEMGSKPRFSLFLSAVDEIHDENRNAEEADDRDPGADRKMIRDNTCNERSDEHAEGVNRLEDAHGNGALFGGNPGNGGAGAQGLTADRKLGLIGVKRHRIHYIPF